MPLNLPDSETMSSGHVGCPGCGAAIAMKFVLKALGEKTMMVLPACCWSIIAGALSPVGLANSADPQRL